MVFVYIVAVWVVFVCLCCGLVKGSVCLFVSVLVYTKNVLPKTFVRKCCNRSKKLFEEGGGKEL